MLLPGQQAARVRRTAAELLCRYLGGDLSLVNEVCRNRGMQEQLAVQNPDDARRVFGEAVEATGPMGEEQLALEIGCQCLVGLCTTMYTDSH